MTIFLVYLLEIIWLIKGASKKIEIADMSAIFGIFIDVSFELFRN